MDIIFIEGLRIDTTIGIYDWEREIKQTVIIDLEMGLDTLDSACSDRIEHTVSYKTVAKRVIEVVGQAQFQLVEALAQHVALIVFDEFAAVMRVRIKVNKVGALSDSSGVGVIIERERFD